MKLYDSGIYLVNGRDIVEEENMTQPVSREEAARNTMAYAGSTQYFRKYAETAD